MKRFDASVAAVLFLYLAAAVSLCLTVRGWDTGEDLGYKLEINKIMQGLEEDGAFSKPDLHGMDHIRGVSFLAEGAGGEEVTDFYRSRNGLHMTVRPLRSEEEALGYVRFDYITEARGGDIWLLETVLAAGWLLTAIGLGYIRQKILKPFHAMSAMPYELAKGHLEGELEESKNRYFGKFTWGIAMLRDALREARNRELRLEKEKKLLLLSLSHDIKIPLSVIRLYARALQERMYDTREQERHAALQIGRKAEEIEAFVKEIMDTAGGDTLVPKVENSQFYLKDYMEKVRKIYEPKCRLALTGFTIADYENKLLEGDMDRALEVIGNLLDNAFKYGDGGLISIAFYEEDYCQVIEVYNTGTPVAKEEIPHLFDSFYRASNAGAKEGNGLGLYINRQLMRRMGGDIFVRKEEKGMCFGLVFCIA